MTDTIVCTTDVVELTIPMDNMSNNDLRYLICRCIDGAVQLNQHSVAKILASTIPISRGTVGAAHHGKANRRLSNVGGYNKDNIRTNS